MKKYRLYGLLGIFSLLFSCSDNMIKEQESDVTPIKLSGALTRAGETPRNNIYVKAYYNNSPNVYFDETLANIPAGLSTTDINPIVFPGVAPYYPLGNEGIRIIAYSGKAPGGLMTLTAGTGIANDAVLSNYGKRTSDIDDVDQLKLQYEPVGTIGTSSDPVELLQFRHVMTQLIVDTIIDQSSHVDRLPENIQFTLEGNGVITSGRYPVRDLEANAQAATDMSTTKYTVRLGTNYLVPSGVNLVGVRMESLRIDDYTAQPSDLTNYIISPREAGYNDMYLTPGASYRLTLTISRMRLTGITLTKSDWEPHVVTGNLAYTPYILNLDLGEYSTTQGNDTISRVLLVTNGNKQYIGKSVGGQLQFVTLPTAVTPEDQIASVIVYTDKGRLISTPLNSTDVYTYNEAASTLQLNLSRGGMRTADGTAMSETNPYLITTAVQFMNINSDLAAHYRQVATVDLNTLNLISDDRIFNGFGDFTGSFDGNGNRIDGLDIQASGLFNSNAGTIKNIRLTSGVINAAGSDYAGSMVGVNTGNVIACVNESRIENTDGATTIQGGIVGQNSGRVIACVNTGTILKGDVAGGIAGENLNTNPYAFVSCINTGALNPMATYLGYVCAKSTPTSNDVIVVRTSFGLVGTAQHLIGSPELAIGTDNNVGREDVSAVEPAILRNGLEQGETDPARRIVPRLNQALADTDPVTGLGVAAEYRFVYSYPGNTTDPVTGLTWPAPVKNNP